MSDFDLGKAVQEATEQWKLTQIITERFRSGPQRHHWIAVQEGYYWQGEPQGWGRTEQEAIDDLKDQLENK
jgi:hypothetical protein